ncbi:MAG: S1 RNA-binding domain-containing protein, partial [Pirellulales bacterium]
RSETGSEPKIQSREQAGAPSPQSPPDIRPADDPAAADASPTGEASDGEPPADGRPPQASHAAGKPKIKIGSQRDRKPPAKAKPQQLEKGAEVAAGKQPDRKPAPKTELPNLRSQLSDEMQREYEAALGGGELDSLLTRGAADVVKQLEEGSEQTGTIVSMREESVFVDLGGRDQGVLSSKQFPEAPQIGQQVTIRINSFNAADGLYEVSLPGAAMDVADWSDLSEGAVLDVIVTGHNKGGLDAEVNRIRGFIPISQIDVFRVDDLEQFVGQKFTCVATEVNPEKRNLVLSRRAIIEREREQQREKLLEALEVGQTREGVVRKLEKFGAFVDIGGLDGLIHISKLSWDHVRHPSDVLEVGQTIKVRIEKIDAASGKIGLGYRDLFESPWVKAAENYAPGAIVKGVVSKVADFGAFVKLEPGVEGLVHISEIAHHRVNRAADYLKEGEEVETKVLTVDPDKQRIGLSIKALTDRPESAKTSKQDDYPEVESPKIKNKHSGELKGGTNSGAGGDQFGLKW